MNTTEDTELKQETTWKEREHPSIYANLVAFSMTPYDISLLLGEVESASATEVIGVPRVKLLLSPELVAKLAQVLALAVEAFARTNGPLRGSILDTAHLRKAMEEKGYGSEGK